MKVKFAVVIAAGLALSACQAGPGQMGGGLVGAGLGGLAGSQIGSGTGTMVAVGIGSALGGLLGSELGRMLDERDQQQHATTYQRAMEDTQTGQARSWSNPDTGNRGEIVPVRTYTRDGRDCRDFTQTIYVDGRAETGRGTACRAADGTWQVVA
jgi:surface antigen